VWPREWVEVWFYSSITTALVVSSTPRPQFTPGKDPVPIVQEAGWAPEPVWTGGKFRPHRGSIPDRSDRSQSLYWATRPIPYIHIYKHIYIYIHIYTVPVWLYSFMTPVLEGGEWSAARPGRTLTPGKTRYPFYRRLIWPNYLGIIIILTTLINCYIDLTIYLVNLFLLTDMLPQHQINITKKIAECFKP